MINMHITFGNNKCQKENQRSILEELNSRVDRSPPTRK